MQLAAALIICPSTLTLTYIMCTSLGLSHGYTRPLASLQRLTTSLTPALVLWEGGQKAFYPHSVGLEAP